MKKLPSILAGTIITLFAGVLVAHAVEPSYTPLAPLPGTFTGAPGAETTTMSTYLSGMLKLIIALGAVTSVLMAIIGGTQYVAAGISPSAKQGAMERIQGAVTGLILILVSWLILNSISPNLVNFNLNLPKIGASPTTTGTVSPTVVGTEPAPLSAAETSIRGQLTGVTVVRSFACQGMRYQDFATQYPGKGCTTMEGLPMSAINGVNALKNTCSACTISITGGAEAGHITHGSGIANIDIGKNQTLDSFITTGKTPQYNKSCGISSAAHYYITGGGAGTYVNEGTHWHVCY